ncbi:MAG: protease [Gammaproteobacteria bacterium SG8_47]|nr:MAG: protease [Gammaproteobacteria bacterium SG8_47]
MELVCPAGNLPSLEAAVEHGADAVYIGFRDETNARHSAGLNFDAQTMAQGVELARSRGVQVYVALNTYPRPDGWTRWQQAVDHAAELGVQALIVADLAVMDYAARHCPGVRLHLSVQASSTNYESIRFYHEHFGIRRAVLPRILSLQQVERIAAHSPVAVEVFGFGNLCVMVEGRCLLSSYATGRSPNTWGVCSPASAIEWHASAEGLETRLGGLLIDRYPPGRKASYPQMCKGRYEVQGQVYHALEEPVSLNTLDLLPELQEAGVAAVKIEGRQRSPTYVAQATRVWRAALDECERAPLSYRSRREWQSQLAKVAERYQTSLGAYGRPWQ